MEKEDGRDNFRCRGGTGENNMKASHEFIVAFGDNSNRKGITLRPSKDDDVFVELLFGDLILESGRTFALGDTVPDDVELNVFSSLRFQEQKDWDNFVNIVNHHDAKLKKWVKEKAEGERTT